MGKSNIIHDIEVIADRVSKQNIRKHQNLIRLGEWVKELQEENKLLKQRLFTLELRVKKLNDYGATPLTRAEQAAEQQRQEQPKQKITGAHLKRFRLGRSLSQEAMGSLFDASAQKYARWESGRFALAPAVEERFREIQKWPATKLRTELQERGHFLTTGKKTKMPKLPVQKEQPEVVVQPAPVTETPQVISKEQIRQLREALGYTRPQLADLIGCKKRTLASWENGERTARGEFAEKLLDLFKKQFAAQPKDPKQEQPSSVNRQSSTRKIYESPIMPVAKIRAGRAASGMSGREVAEALGVPVTTYKNWESGNCRPSDIYIEKMQSLFGSFPTESARASAEIEKTPISPDKITCQQLRDFRHSIGVTRLKLANYLQIPLSQYQNWEHPSRCVPFSFQDKVRELMNMNPDEAKLLLGITEATPPPAPAAEPVVEKTNVSRPAITCDDIRKFRLYLGLSGQQMADFLKVPHSVYKNWETKKRRVGDEFYDQVAPIYNEDKRTLKGMVSKFLGGRKPGARNLGPQIQTKPNTDTRISGEEMRQIRLRFGIPQIQMAAFLKVDMSSYQHWEIKGRFVPQKYVDRVLEISDLSVDEFQKRLSAAGIVARSARPY